EERAELDALTERFFQEVGWTPRRVAQIAGAVKFTDYDFFRYWALRWIVRNRDPGVTGREDVEYTNWATLTELVTDWASEAAS
ncbi:MAG: protoporphyrinogen oxidase, partial [Gemmobacter sp.]